VVRLSAPVEHKTPGGLGIGFVGAGNYASVHLIPHLKRRNDVQLLGVVSATGLNARQKADKFGFSYCATNIDPLLDDPNIQAVFIGTRHRTHAELTIQTLRAGKHVFVEKPMVVTEEQLAGVIEAYEQANATQPTSIMVGLNRRFAPMIVRLKQAFTSGEALQMIYRVNSGNIPTSTWLHEDDEGGGMLIGEMCHFVDVMQYLCGQRPAEVYARALSVDSKKASDHDNLSIVIGFEGGSVGTLCYNTVGNSGFPKERLEVYGGGTVGVIDDFRLLEIMSGGKRARVKSSNQDKGQKREISETIDSFRAKGVSPIPFLELVAGMRVIFAARQSAVSGLPVTLTV
jgi:predicted dehydrogenase